MNRLSFLAAISLLVLVGCLPAGSVANVTPDPGASPNPHPTPTAHATTRLVAEVPADELLFAGSLLICSDLPYPPQEFFDELGNPIGSDIEIGEEIARRLGLRARIVDSLFDTIIDAVQAGKCDIVISAQNITAEREAQVDMIPYFQAGQSFVVASGNPAAIHNRLDLCGRRIGAQSGTVQEQLIEGSGEYEGAGLSDGCAAIDKPQITLVAFGKDDEALRALLDGRIDAYFTDSPAAGYHVIQNVDRLELAGLTLDVAVQGISVPKNRQGLRDSVQTALASMMADGTYQAILARYGVGGGSVAGAVGP